MRVDEPTAGNSNFKDDDRAIFHLGRWPRTSLLEENNRYQGSTGDSENLGLAVVEKSRAQLRFPRRKHEQANSSVFV